jgi:hypothetical protein
MNSATHYQKPKKEKRKKTRLQREKERSRRETSAGHHGQQAKVFKISPVIATAFSPPSCSSRDTISLSHHESSSLSLVGNPKPKHHRLDLWIYSRMSVSLSLSPSQFLSPYRSSLSLSRSHLQPSFCFVFYGLLLCVTELLLKCEIK